MLDFDGTWDIECADWDRFVVGGIFNKKTGAYKVHWDPNAMARDLLAREGIYYAHNGGRYDFLWLIDQCAKMGVKYQGRPRGAGLLSVKIGKLEVRDSYALIPMSLAAGSEMGKVQKSKLRLECDCRAETKDKQAADCGGFCRLGRLTWGERAIVEEYLETDCRSTAAMLDALSEFTTRDEIELRLTVGASAWRTAKNWIGLEPCGYDVATYTTIREGYYGGRCEVHRATGARGHRHDIHASYPAALARVNLPAGQPRSLAGAEAARAWERGAPGVFWADCYVPRCSVPPLPTRVDERLLYPWGAIRGAWTRVTLGHALACGAQLRRVTRAYVWPREAPVLAPFAERVWSLRDARAFVGSKSDLEKAPQSVKASNAYSKWLKWLANSLTGKLAQRPINSTLHFTPHGENVEFDIEPVRQTARGTYHIIPSIRVDECAHVIWSAYLTSEAHRKLHTGLLNSTQPWYCDTDSVYSLDKMTHDVGPNLGQWGYEGEANEWKAVAPKVYMYRDEKGAYNVRGKGMSGLTVEGFEALTYGASWTIDRGVDGFKTRMRKGGTDFFVRRLLSRGLHGTPGWVGGRRLHPDGSTSAPSLAEWAGRAKVSR